ncbi:MAG: AMP-dependent synthetase/ligase [Bacteroidia bacterium]
MESLAAKRMENDPKFRSLHDFLLNSANKIHNPQHHFLHQKIDGEWKSITYQEVINKANLIAAFLLKSGINKGDRVAVILENCPEYYMLDQALQKLGNVNVSIYPTLTPDETKFIINDSGSRMVFVGNPFLLKKVQKVEPECPTLEKIIFMPSNKEEVGSVINFSSVIEIGEQALPEFSKQIEEQFQTVTKDDLATLIYTSGTTGVPKGAMLTHYNFMSNCYDAKELCPAIMETDLYLSFLPLSHVFERMATMYLGIYVGASIAFSEGIEKVASNIMEIRPTVMATVPRLLERIHDKVIKNATAGGGIKAKIFLWAVKVGAAARVKKENGNTLGPILGMQLSIAEKLVFSKIKTKMGGRMKMFVSGGGALPKHVGEFFANLGLKVQEGYGLTETSPFVTVNEFERQVYGTVGRVAPRQYVAIQNIETKEIITIQHYDSFNPDFVSEEGEILTKGPNVMKGYWQNEAETKNVFDEDGWFHTGDIGKFEKGYLKITDRLKNMLKTSLGKNIYPTQIENVYLQSDRIEQIFIIGDKREFLTAIIVPNKETAEEQIPEKLSAWDTEDDFIYDSDLEKWIAEDAKKISRNMAKFERIRNFRLKREPFSIENGDMTITLKVKRKVVLEKYNAQIEQMYSEKDCPL